MTRRTLVLTNAEVQSLEKLKEHCDDTNTLDTTHRGGGQGSLLRRQEVENGDLVFEKGGKKYVIPGDQ